MGWERTNVGYYEIMAICSLLWNNIVSPMGNNLFPWCICYNKAIHMVTYKIKIQDEDGVCSVSKFYAMLQIY